jgi:hypothetical protein
MSTCVPGTKPKLRIFCSHVRVFSGFWTVADKAKKGHSRIAKIRLYASLIAVSRISGSASTQFIRPSLFFLFLSFCFFFSRTLVICFDRLFRAFLECKVDLVQYNVFQIFSPFFARGRHEQNFKNVGRADEDFTREHVVAEFGCEHSYFNLLMIPIICVSKGQSVENLRDKNRGTHLWLTIAII